MLPADAVWTALTTVYGTPTPGAQEAELRTAVAKLIGLASEQRAMRRLLALAEERRQEQQQHQRPRVVR